MNIAPLTRSADVALESKKILDEMKNELSVLEDRVKLLEKENAENNALKEQLVINRGLNDQLLQKMDEDKEYTDTNVMVMSDLIDELKSPVHNVVSNLTEWGSSFRDEEIKNSFDECVNAAQKVLRSFNKVDTFSRSMKKLDPSAAKNIDLRKKLKDMLVRSFDTVSNFKLFIDKNLPDTIFIHAEMLLKSLETVLNTLLNPKSESRQIMISIMKKHDSGVIQNDRVKLLIRVVSNEPTDIVWKDDWYESVNVSGKNDRALRLEWLEVKNGLRGLNGNLRILSNDSGNIIGSEIDLPLR